MKQSRTLLLLALVVLVSVGLYFAWQRYLSFKVEGASGATATDELASNIPQVDAPEPSEAIDVEMDLYLGSLDTDKKTVRFRSSFQYPKGHELWVRTGTHEPVKASVVSADAIVYEGETCTISTNDDRAEPRYDVVLNLSAPLPAAQETLGTDVLVLKKSAPGGKVPKATMFDVATLSPALRKQLEAESLKALQESLKEEQKRGNPSPFRDQEERVISGKMDGVTSNFTYQRFVIDENRELVRAYGEWQFQGKVFALLAVDFSLNGGKIEARDPDDQVLAFMRLPEFESVDDWSLKRLFRYRGIFDANGDGKAEILRESWGYESSAMSLHPVTEEGLLSQKAIFEEDCGL